MKQSWIFLFSWGLRLVVRFIFAFTGRGGGKLATLLPKGQTYLVSNYCDRYKFNVDTTYPMESAIWLSGVYDIATTKLFRKVIRKNDIFLDIGANCGAIAFVAASIIDEGKVYAFEPAPTIGSRLQANINLNPQLQNIVRLVPLGLGLSKGQLLYYEDPNYRGNGALQQITGIPVSVISLDEWVILEKLAKIDAIKIDVEGMEYEVLLGAKTVLEKFHPLIYLETLPLFYENRSYTIRNIYELLATFGYKIISPTEPYLEISLDGPYPPNSVAIHPNQADRLSSVFGLLANASA